MKSHGAVIKLQSGAIYEGEILHSKRSGTGLISWPDGAKYEGQWKHNLPSGKGKFIHTNGDYY